MAYLRLGSHYHHLQGWEQIHSRQWRTSNFSFTSSRQVVQVLPPTDIKSPSETVPRYFEGNSTPPIITGTLLPEEIERQVQAGPPPPKLPQGPTYERTLTGRLIVTTWPAAHQSLTGPWQLQLPSRALSIPTLIPLNQHSEPSLRYFAGTLTYRTIFTSPTLTSHSRLYLDLGRVDIAAAVRINGKPAGMFWKPPYRLHITSLVYPGDNVVEIDVTTLWPNRLIGDEHLRAENEYDPHGPIKQFPTWFTSGQPKPPGGRVTFTTWHHYNAADPLLQSGLSGPVTLLHAVESNR